ncbi:MULTISPECIES: hypothetical protein [Thalassospira]|uniref:Secreted protein n=1 Tax=Thalassospira aquimaris TaxID=3037796 RepID=A0ABT6GAE4_9PROT|nr:MULTISPECIES: hypothetical protein [Thalassospira]MDG4719051.1 hypothetical protein [Thalassospira sp. FZY0004]
MNRYFRNTVFGIMLITVVLPIGLSLMHSNAHSASWRETKCTLYQTHRDDLRAKAPSDGFSPAFDQQEAAFVASGCTERVYACPQTKAELDYANLMSVVMTNEGATGSFLPFGCKEPGR